MDRRLEYSGTSKLRKSIIATLGYLRNEPVLTITPAMQYARVDLARLHRRSTHA